MVFAKQKHLKQLHAVNASLSAWIALFLCACVGNASQSDSGTGDKRVLPGGIVLVSEDFESGPNSMNGQVLEDVGDASGVWVRIDNVQLRVLE